MDIYKFVFYIACANSPVVWHELGIKYFNLLFGKRQRVRPKAIAGELWETDEPSLATAVHALVVWADRLSITGACGVLKYPTQVKYVQYL